VTYTIVSQWTGGFQGEVKIACSQAVNGWKVGWAFPNGQTITQIWGGAFQQSGASVTVDNAPWNAAITANGSVTFGFIGKWTGANGKPIGFSVNGRPA
jgi:endo-1,4-beta-xylanase